ncbi:hypothetical protein SLEP1_g43942 [Rubroshorea leprosula]|uniref:Uncharacterized protein n=1 Tax=Rubroshorea leprosula TaxID=152421 RepID=A0AAV5LGE5_9ROSI|nr:hypothetical protein SLEP1_g43942 [Rubroshorea leprosula]
MVNQLNYCNFNDDVPPYLINFLELLDNFDELLMVNRRPRR